MRNVLILLAFALFTGIFGFFYDRNFVVIQIEFDKLRPVKEKINVYYNGFKIGHTKKFAPCELSKGTCVEIAINKKAMFLPDNITAKMKQKKIHERKYEDFIEIVYPETPSFIELGNGAKIKGELAAGFNNYMNEEVSYSDMDGLKLSLINTTQNLEKATSILVDILDSLNNMTKASESEIGSASKNINSSMKNINSITKKLDDSVNPEIIKSIMRNLDNTLGNINDSTYNLKNFTGQIQSSNTVYAVDSIARNTDEIVQGVNCTLRKSFGGLRLLFGKVIR